MLALDGSSQTGTSSFASYRFWANVGETFHLDVSGVTSARVFRVLDIGNVDRSADDPFVFNGLNWDTAFPVASIASSIDLTIDHTGYHYIAIGSPGATEVQSVVVAAKVTRRVATTGVKRVATGMFRTCALLEAGTVKCWGDDEIEGQPKNDVPGGTLASMGDALPAVPLPGKAVSIAMAAQSIGMTGSGGFLNVAATTGMLEDGSVYTWSRLVAPQRISLDDQAVELLDQGSCARLANGTIQCWSYESEKRVWNATPAISWPGHMLVKAVSDGRVVCGLLDQDVYACKNIRAQSAAAWPEAATALPLEPGEHVLDVAAELGQICFLTARASYCSDLAVNFYHEPPFREVVAVPLPPGTPTQFLVNENELTVVMQDLAKRAIDR